ncbi:major facilitator superfamily domain-containing protein [Melanogaster broomeanus]|nr:major facilitator superfamily domain-containing protein [Melanogaster broomeanus]
MSFDSEKKSKPSPESVVTAQPVPDNFILLTEENREGEERKLVRKLDLRLMPTVLVIYLINYIDRIAITAIRVKGIETDLHLTDVQYYTLLTGRCSALYTSCYRSAQIPSNMPPVMFVRTVCRPSFYIGASSCIVAWGLSSVLTGVTKNFADIIACRLFIGLPEAAFYPGAMYLLSRWYTKKELALRSAIFYVCLLISNALSSWIAAGILGNTQGKLGISAWRWLFFVEGAITMFFGLLTMWVLPDSPYNTEWLSSAERHLAQVRLAEDAGEADQDSLDTTIFEGFNLAIRDPKVWIFMMMSCSQLLGLSFINFFPTLTAILGYDTTVTLLMAALPWVFASICCVVNAWNCDRTGEHYLHLASWWWVAILGYFISLATMSTGGRYLSLFLVTTGYCGFALTLTWVSNAVPRPPAKRSAAIGLVNGFGNLGNLMGSYIWQASWGPEYHQSMIIAICSLVLSTFLGLIIRQMLIRENSQMDRLDWELLEGPERDHIHEAARLEGITFEEAMRRRKGFRYLY